jgi:hypothetical protein
VPIAIENDELREAIALRPVDGRGRILEARLLPLQYDTVRYRAEPRPSVQAHGEPPVQRPGEPAT